MPFYEVMDSDLWGPPCSQGSPESTLHGLPQSFWFDNGLDEMEQNALNENACAQVLRRLIAKADTEIDELEESLALLKIQQAWAENKDWPNMCSSALSKKIKCLDISLKTSRDEILKENDTDFCLRLHREPAEGIHEIVKGLHKIWCQPIDAQPATPTGKYSSSDSLRRALDHSHDKKIVSEFDARSTGMEQDEEHDASPDRNTIQKPSLRPEDKKKDPQETIQPAETCFKILDTCIKNPSLALKYSGDHFYEIVESSSLCLRDVKEEFSEQCATAKEPVIESSSKAELEQQAEEQPADTSVQNSSSTSMYGTDCSSEIVNLMGLEIVKEEVIEHPSATAETPVMVSSSKAEGKGIELQKQGKLENTVNKDSGSDALTHGSPCSYKKKVLSNSGLEVIDKGEGKNHNPASTKKSDKGEGKNHIPFSTRKSMILKSSSNSGGKVTNCLKSTKNANTIMKELSSNASRQATNPNAEKYLSKINLQGMKKEIRERSSDLIMRARVTDSAKGTIIAEKPKFANTYLRLRSLSRPTKDVQLKPSEGQKDAQTSCILSSTEPSKSEEKGTNLRQIACYQKEAGVADTETLTKTSLLNLQEQVGKNAMKSQPKRQQLPHLKVTRVVEVSANYKKASSASLPKPQMQKAKRKTQSNPVCISEQDFSPTGADLTLSVALQAAKKQRRPRIAMNTKADNCRAIELFVAPNHSTDEVLTPQPLKVIKDSKALPQMSCQQSAEHNNSTRNENTLQMIEFRQVHDENVESLLAERVAALELLKVVELRVIGKALNLKSIWQLRKAALIRAIAEAEFGDRVHGNRAW